MGSEEKPPNPDNSLDEDSATFAFPWGDCYLGWRSPELSTHLEIVNKDYHVTGTWYIRHYEDMDIVWQPYQADIIDVKSESLVWCPPETQDIRWFRGGNDIIVLRLFDRESLHCSAEYQGYDVYERYSWPKLTLLGRCTIKTPFPGARLLVGSPRGDLVVVQWWHQGEAGLEFIQVDDEKGDNRLIHPGFSWEALQYRPWHRFAMSGVPADEFLCTEPMFSPSGRYIVFGQEDDLIGNIVVLDWDSKQLSKIYLESDDSWYYVPPSPNGLQNEGYKHMDHIIFLNEELVEVVMTSGWRQRVHIL